MFTRLTPLKCTPVYRGQARLIGIQLKSLPTYRRALLSERLEQATSASASHHVQNGCITKCGRFAVSAQSQVMPELMQG